MSYELYIIIMSKAVLTSTIRQFTNILRKYHIEGKTLRSHALEYFGELIDALANQILCFNSSPSSPQEKAAKVQLLAEVLDKQEPQPTLNSIAKKLSIMAMLLRRLVQEEAVGQQMENTFKRVLNKLLKEDLPCLINGKQKRSSSINKIYSYIRELSGSKQKDTPGKTKLQHETQKGAVKEIIGNIFQPYCCYLLKMVQDHQKYFTMIRKRQHKQEGSLRWTMMNSAKMLGQLIYQLHRFGRYFINDLLGILVYLTFVVSKDVAVFYDALMREAEGEAEHWRLVIEEEEKCVREKGAEGRKVYRMTEFKEAKGFIDQLLAVRQKIHYIFGNKALKDFRHLFSKPAKYSLREDRCAQGFEILLEYHRKASRWSQQAHSLDTSSNELYISHSHAIYSKQPLTPMPHHVHPKEQPKSETFHVQQQDLEYKLASTVSCKPRMNNWLNRAQRNKNIRIPPTIMAADKDDVISTNQ